MARPVEFVYDTVMERATDQFWRDGFEASSVQKLLDATDINRGTLYNSFGDKDTFFKSCVERYNSKRQALMAATLGDQALKADRALAAFLDASVINAPARQRAMGCLLVNSICESIAWDSSVLKLVRESLNAIRKALLSRARELEKAKALARGLSVEAAADLLLNLYISLNVQARSGKTPKQLADMAHATLAQLQR